MRPMRPAVLAVALACAGCVVTRQRYDDLRSENLLLEAKSTDLQREKEKLAADKASTDAVIARGGRDLGKLEQRVKDLRESNVELMREVRESRRKIADLEKKAGERDAARAKDGEERAALARKCERIEKERVAVQRQYRELVEQYAQAQRRISELEKPGAPAAPPAPPPEGGGLDVSGGPAEPRGGGMEYRAWFQCIGGCGERYPLDEVVYQCRKCGELLEVRHDMDALRATPGGEWRRLWDRRYRRSEWPYGSSVWGKKELVLPAVRDENVVSLYEGGSNLFRASRFGAAIGVDDLWVKLCGNDHTGSFKDLGMTVLVSMVNQMIKDGRKIVGVACASTGDTSAALAAYGAAAGLPVPSCFLPRGMVSDRAARTAALARSASPSRSTTDFDGCMTAHPRESSEPRASSTSRTR